jgi:hypothetical protein
MNILPSQILFCYTQRNPHEETSVMLKYYQLFGFLSISVMTMAQCDGLKGNKAILNTWKSEYCNYFSVDSTTTQLISADSVLIYYLSDSSNDTNYGMPCCYYLAGKYAQIELRRNVKLLYKKLEKEDSISFSKAQGNWKTYYNAEVDFIKGAFIGYANFVKYGQGCEIMINDAARIYQMIKDRILTIKSYIELASQGEDGNSP